MKKIAILVVALIAMVAFTSVATAQLKKVTVESEITLKFKEDNSPYGEGGLFSGKVSAKKDCQEDRKVKVFAKDGGRVGKAVTDKSGRYAVEADNVGPGKYVAEVKQRAYRQGKKKIVCLAATSDRVVVK